MPRKPLPLEARLRAPGGGRKQTEDLPRVAGTVTLTRTDWEALEAAGEGNRSEGVRRLLHPRGDIMSRYKSGRPNGRPLESAEQRISRTITMSREEWAALEAIGNGKCSAGARALLAATQNLDFSYFIVYNTYRLFTKGGD